MDLKSRYPYGPSFILGSRGGLTLGLVAEHEEAVKFVATELSVKTAGALERLSTALYVRAENPGLKDEEATKRIHELKPHVKLGQAADAICELHNLEVAAREVLTPH